MNKFKVGEKVKIKKFLKGGYLYLKSPLSHNVKLFIKVVKNIDRLSVFIRQQYILLKKMDGIKIKTKLIWN